MTDPSQLLNALILGIIEGLTEFLPVSSTGHLILAGQLLGFNDDKGKVFEIAIQFAAILAVVWEYRARLGHAVVSLGTDKASQRLATNLIVAFMPAAVLGFLFIKQIKFYLFNPIVVASALIIGGVLILWAERRTHVVRAETVDEMTWRDALKVGFAQALAMIPGTSRSGATIIGGLFFGLSRKAAAEFSFFLAIPTMFAATLYDVYKNSRPVQRGRYRAVCGGRRRVVHQRLVGGARLDPVYQPSRFHRVCVVSHRVWRAGVADGIHRLGRLGHRPLGPVNANFSPPWAGFFRAFSAGCGGAFSMPVRWPRCCRRARSTLSGCAPIPAVRRSGARG